MTTKFDLRSKGSSARFRGGGPFRSARATPTRSFVRLPKYEQVDRHSCGFLAVLTVVRCYWPGVSEEEVFRVVRPSKWAGCDRRGVVRALAEFGVDATFRSGLGLRSLFRCVAGGAPVIVTVWPEWSGSDHWTVVRGVDLREERVFLANFCGTDADGGMSWEGFSAVWFDRGEGLVCRAARRG
jgi:hypothetical protein